MSYSYCDNYCLLFVMAGTVIGFHYVKNVKCCSDGLVTDVFLNMAAVQKTSLGEKFS